MKLYKVISGGQTGADKTALECAKALGFTTGGTAPKGYKTEAGPDFSLRDTYNLRESYSSDYTVRTRTNVQDADITVWFGTINSPGYVCTKNATVVYGKGMILNPSQIQMEYIAHTYGIINVAGNRKSKNPVVVDTVKRAFGYIALLQERERGVLEGVVNQYD